MKSAEDGSATAEIVAALVWDVPTLRRGSQSARDFARALPGEAEKWWEPRTFADDPLGKGARAVAHERAGDLAGAAAGYADLASYSEPFPRLLGLMLCAWSETAGNVEVVVDAHRAAREADVSDEVRARLLAKVATYAIDAGQLELGREVLAEAFASVGEGTQLRRALAVVVANAGLGQGGLLATAGEELPPIDPLVDYPWIEYQSLDGAQRALRAEVERRARRAWSWHMTLGVTTPLDEVVAAEVQATWAGALWLRPRIRLQLGGHLLTGFAESPQQWAYGVLMWALGGGHNPERIYRFAEPNLDHASIEFLVRALDETGFPNPSRFLAVASAAWDAVSDETLRWVISQTDPVASDHPLAREVHGLWAAYAARLADEWFADFATRPREVKVALIESLGTGALAHLSGEARRVLFEVAWSEVQRAEHPDTQIMRVAVSTALAPRRRQLSALISDKARPSAVARLAGEHLEALLPEALARAKESLLEDVRRETEEARNGKVSFGSDDSRLSLGRLLARLDHDPEAAGLLLRIAIDHELPGEHILTARNALAVMRREGRLSAEERQALHGVDDPVGTFPEHGDLSPGLLRAARLQVLALELTPDEASEVVSGCRAPETRTRMVSLATCAEAVATPEAFGDKDAFSWSLIGGLFDPDDEVVAAVLRAIPEAMVSAQPAAAQVAISRLLPLYEAGSTPVREAVAQLARRWAAAHPDSAPAVGRVLSRLPSDKSWLVRTLDAEL